MNKEREKSILEMLLKYKKVSVRDLEKALFASESSIRRDLADLERQNLIKRVHGGAGGKQHQFGQNSVCHP